MESRGGGVVKVKDTEQDGVGWRRPALSLPVEYSGPKFPGLKSVYV